MKATLLILLFSVVIITDSESQEFNWKLGFSGFFDNNEFAGSAYQIPQTMAGVIVSPELGLGWDSVHRVSAGIQLLHEFGSINILDEISPTAYYMYNKAPWKFIMGAFPREYALDRYPRVFFRDSVSYYRPNMNGMLWEIKKDNNYINLWLDWTSRVTETERETFFAGFSGRYNMGIFFARHFGYMYHFSLSKDPVRDETLHDNILLLTGAGIDLSGRTFFDNLEVSAGWIAGLERARAHQTGWMQQNGFLFETRIGYRRFSLHNSYYRGKDLYLYYNDYGNELYWGDPMYQAGSYNRSDLYVRFLHTGKVRLDLIYSLHFAEADVFHEQALKLKIDLNNY